MSSSPMDGSARGAKPDLEPEISLLAMASVLVRWRWAIIAFGITGGLIGLATGLLSPRMYVSRATLVPKDAEQTSSGLAAAASQFGIRLTPGASGSTWGPPMYVKLVKTGAFLAPMVFDTLVVVEEENRRATLLELLGVEGATEGERVDRAVYYLSGMIGASEDRRLGSVELSVTTRWPSVSLAIAELVIERLNEFNIQTRQSQAASERRFVEAQTLEAERALRGAEERLKAFLQRNRVCCSPELAFERDRLENDVSMRRQLYSSWLQNREEARIREVRDTPVITVIEPPRYAFVGEARRSARKGLLGGVAGGMIAIGLALVSDRFRAARLAPSKEAQEFFGVVGQALPRFLRRPTA